MRLNREKYNSVSCQNGPTLAVRRRRRILHNTGCGTGSAAALPALIVKRSRAEVAE